ncbi:hypothetical protein AMTR_s00032p00115430 [Amborella trichopoda]|uniref:F-box domain-containing protein n=1 Tax=Amborella trichopoda TaxID=13333 RepID=U5CNU6_AMBTC|nr:hypothetical protein AMTR_s00032p00115430 [Amborella trichopoda]
MGTLSNTLSDDIMEIILLSLPVKVLVNLKTVSRSWNQFLSSPSFAKAHFLTPHPSHPLVLFLRRENDHILFLHDYPNDRKSHRSNLRVSMRMGGIVCRRMAESHGILCCLSRELHGDGQRELHGDGQRDVFFVVNPVTSQCTFVPSFLDLEVLDFGFYFDPQNCNYKILAGVKFGNSGKKVSSHRRWDSANRVRYLIFNSSAQQWRIPKGTCPTEISPPRNTCIFLDRFLGDRISSIDSIIGITIGQTTYHLFLKYLMAFDMEMEEVKIIPIPPRILRNVISSSILVREGNLTLVQLTKFLKVTLWTLMEDKNWEELVTIDISELVSEGSEDAPSLPLLFPFPLLGEVLFMSYCPTEELNLKKHGPSFLRYNMANGLLHVVDELSELRKLNPNFRRNWQNATPIAAFWEEHLDCYDRNFLLYKPTLFSWKHAETVETNSRCDIKLLNLIKEDYMLFSSNRKKI